MSVVLTDMEVPKSCGECKWFNQCSAIDVRKIIESGVRPDFTVRCPDCPLVEAIPKVDYETRLKADMVAMLEELEKELKEVKCNYLATIHVDIAEEYFNLAKVEGLYLIRQKISKLKGDEE